MLLAACGGGSGSGSGSGSDRPGATVPDGEAGGSTTTTAPDASTTTSIDITTKPATITVAYADAVMDELDRVLSDAIREFVANNGPTKSFDDKLNAVYDEPSLENARSVYGDAAVDGMHRYRRPPGDVTTTVKELLKVEEGCVVAQVERTFSATLVSPIPRSKATSFIGLEPTDEGGDPADLNSTPWSIVFDGDVLEGEEPRNAC